MSFPLDKILNATPKEFVKQFMKQDGRICDHYDVKGVHYVDCFDFSGRNTGTGIKDSLEGFSQQVPEGAEWVINLVEHVGGIGDSYYSPYSASGLALIPKQVR
jgi:hypothetical protein